MFVTPFILSIPLLIVACELLTQPIPIKSIKKDICTKFMPECIQQWSINFKFLNNF